MLIGLASLLTGSRGAVAAAITALVTGLAVLVGSPSVAAVVDECWLGSPTDVDGGGPDIAIGLPSYDVGGKVDAGAVVVYSNVGDEGQVRPKAPTSSVILTADDFDGLAAQAGARFGASVLVARVGGAEPMCADVIVGAPGQDVGGKAGAGSVYLLEGSPEGLVAGGAVLDEDTVDGIGGAQAGAGFGSELAVVPAIDEGYVLAIGAPNRDVGSVVDAGRVVRIDGWGADSAGSPTVITQGAGAPGAAEANDHFGAVIRGRQYPGGVEFLVGIPDEDIGSVADAGLVVLLPQSEPPSSVNQNSPGAAGTAEKGDKYGSAIAYFDPDFPYPTVTSVLIGVPGEDLGSVPDAGTADLAKFVGGGPLAGQSQTWNQGSSYVPGEAEKGDRFGAAVTAGTLGDQQLGMVIAAPMEDLGSRVDAGTLVQTWIPYRAQLPASAPWKPGTWNQDSSSVSGAAESGDRFASSLGLVQLSNANDESDYNLLIVTVPGEDIGVVADVGMSYIGSAPGVGSIQLVPPTLQPGAGTGMVPMR